MSGTRSDAHVAKQHAGNGLILTASKSGEVTGVAEAPAALSELLSANASELTLATLWDDSCVAQVRNSIRRAIRTRTSCSFEADEEGGVVREFIVVPRGADRVLLIVRDLTKQKLDEQLTQRLAYTDDVTGLPNREYLLGELQKIVDMQGLKEGRSAVICIHLGQFDDYGYALTASQQDELLSHLANRLEGQLRGTNQSGTVDFERSSVVGRSDYRQFCVVLPSIDTGEDAEAVAERVAEALRVPVNMKARSVVVNSSCGIALYPQDGADAASLYENAIAAMEDARCEKGSAIKFHSGTVRLRTLQRTDLEAELKSALQNGEYALNFMPTVDIECGRPGTMEALLRWSDAVLGLQSTQKIVRVAERTGIMKLIGRWVLNAACEQLLRWREAGHDQIRIAVNVSEQEWTSGELIDSIQAVLQSTGIEPGSLDLEIKESILSREAQNGFAMCRRVADLGARLVVDGFSGGTTSLLHLPQGRVGAIKIDRSIIAGLQEDSHCQKTVAGILALADRLDIVAIAEGVESQQQFDQLSALGCKHAQGFLFTRPLGADAALQYLTPEEAHVDGL